MRRSIALTAALLACAATTGAQGPQVNTVMREKLTHAQHMLEAVVTSDWPGLETHSRALEDLTNDPRWAVLKYPEYARHSAEFVAAVKALRAAAAQRDLDRTPKAYVDVTLQCVDCHRYLARARVVRSGHPSR